MSSDSPFGPPPTPEQMAFNNAPQIMAITGTFFAAAALTVLLRVYVRLSMLKVFGIDDYIMLFAMVLCAATFTCFKLRCDFGLGKHFLVLLMDPNYMKLTKTQYVQSIVLIVGLSAVKVSIAFCLLRLSVQRTYARILYGTIVFMCVMTVACVCTLVFQCVGPISAAWDYRFRPPPFGTGNAKCYNTTVFRNLGLMNSAFHIVTDVLFASLPIPLIWQLSLNTRTKVSLIMILSLGWFACAAGIIKAVKQWNVFSDLDWTVSDSFNVWSFIEFTVGIIAASLPTLKPLFNWFLETARAITTGSRSRGGSYKVSAASGYQNKTEQWNKNIAMESYPSKSGTSPTSSKSPYHVKITTQPTGLADKEGWEAQRKDSDESILPLHPHHALGSNGIVMTREVSVV